MRQYGIFLAYAPVVDLRKEGLGRHLAYFLKGAAELPDVRFVVACPSWGRVAVEQLCASEGIATDHFDFLSPASTPLSLRVYDALKKRRAAKRGGFVRRAVLYAWHKLSGGRIRSERRLVSTRSVLLAGCLSLLIAAIGLLMYLLTLASKLTRWTSRCSKAVFGWMRAKLVENILQLPAGAPFSRYYQLLIDAEVDLLISLINERTDISAWYCPTSFWPEFNRIRAPRLMCVPDFVIADFPTGFELRAGPGLYPSFVRLQKAIQGATDFVTYSDTVKNQVVVGRFGRPPNAVRVVPHAVNGLLDSISVAGTSDERRATDAFSRTLLRRALLKAQTPYASGFQNEAVKFIFYASQLRANKNVITLLRAYAHLLRKRYFGAKLLLTGRLQEAPEIDNFIAENRLSHDVLCLPGLSVQELAACYRLAQVAVCPSLSEGGFPFTFTEAMSVGTPAVLARIPVTEDVVTDPALNSMMLFDGFDWHDMAERIEWAMEHREELAARQKQLYDRLAQRSWRDVAADYVVILDELASADRPAARRS